MGLLAGFMRVGEEIAVLDHEGNRVPLTESEMFVIAEGQSGIYNERDKNIVKLARIAASYSPEPS